MPGKTVTVTYEIERDHHEQAIFTIEYDPQTMTLVTPPTREADWAELDFHRCSNCPLSISDHPRCPVAERLVEVADKVGMLISYESVAVTVRKKKRTYWAELDAQAAISALLGLIMPLSGCPHLAIFQPMARFHLPFADSDETTYRAASMYMLAQYFMRSKGEEVDFTLDGLRVLYEEVRAVNSGLAQRLRESGAFKEVNSIALLDVYTHTLPWAIEDQLVELAPLFKAYLKDGMVEA